MNTRFKLLILFQLIIYSACGSTGVHTTSKSQQASGGKTVFVLFDISDSTKSGDTRQKYMDSFKRILDNISEGDVLVADVISDDPLGQSSFALNEEFPIFQPTTDNDLLVRKQKEEFDSKIQSLRRQAQENAVQMIANTNRTVKWTKILDANLLAERVFKKFDRPKKVLILFSDMIESSAKIDFGRQKLGADDVEQIISNEAKAGRMPDLNGVRVYVVGAVGGKRLDSFSQIQNFWVEYFKAAGADLSKENYGSALLKFDE